MSHLLIPVVLDTTSFCSTLPQTDGAEVSRENLIDLLDTMLTKGKSPSVHLARESGIGKTTLLAQFARKYNGCSVSIFARRSSWFTYDPDFLLRDLLLDFRGIKFAEGGPADSLASPLRLLPFQLLPIPATFPARILRPRAPET